MLVALPDVVWLLFIAVGLLLGFSILHACASEARDRVALHDFKVDVITLRNDYHRRLQALYDGRADDVGEVDFVEPVTLTPIDSQQRAA
ncbi:MAG: hypothetical protein AAF747_04800 [Planctomycetota bacterium]